MRTRTCVAVAFAGAVTVVAASAPGSLDPTFNGTGVMLSAFDGWAGSVLVDQNNQVVVGGYTNDPLGRPGPVNRDFLVARYNANGTALNLSFGGETTILGTAVTDFSDNDVIRAMEMDAAGRIVVAGWMSVHNVGGGEPLDDEKFALARYTSQGIRDVTFNGSGVKLLDFDSDYGYFEAANALAIDALGRIIVGGYSWQGHGFFVPKVYTDFAIARLLPNGDLDPTFGGDGKVLIAFDGPSYVNDIAVDDLGRIVAVGSTQDFEEDDTRVAVVRLQTDGSLDPAFGTGGRVEHTLGRRFSAATALDLDTTGRIVVGGVAADFVNEGGFFFFPDDWERVVPRWPIVYNQTADFAVARLLQDGTLDPQFGSGGITFADFAGRDDVANGLAIDREGRILQVGTTSTLESFQNFAVARYTAAGVLDANFGIAGRTTTDFGDSLSDVAMDVAFDSANRAVVAGFVRLYGPSTPKIAVARYDNGTAASLPRTAELVTTFENAGIIDSHGVSRALTKMLAAAQAATDAGNVQAGRGQLEAFVNLVEAQRGKHIAASATLEGVTFDPASVLIGLARELIEASLAQ
jgi:uncharacterized delta-60 repeat protein